jgi:hypothetical protein
MLDTLHGLFFHFVPDLDWLASQPIQFRPRSKSCSRFFLVLVKIFYVFPRGVNPLGDNCMMTKASLRHGCWRNGGVLGLCWIDDAHHPPLSLLSSSSFGVLVAFVATGSIIAVWHHCRHLCHCHRHRRRCRCRRCCRCCHCCH